MSTGCSSRNTTSTDALPKVKENSGRRGGMEYKSPTTGRSAGRKLSSRHGICSYTCKACRILYVDEGGDREAPRHPYLFVDNDCWERRCNSLQ